MEEKLRLIVYGLLSALISGTLYYIVFIVQGLVSVPPDPLGQINMLGSMMGNIGIDPLILAVMFHSVMGTIVLGGLFGVLLIFLQGYFPLDDRNKMLIFGLIYGLFIFIASQMMMALMMPFALSLATVVGGVAHLIWGAIMGFLVNFFDDKGYFK